MKDLVGLILFAWWIFGISVANGFAMTLGAACIPPLAWLLGVMWLLERFA